MTDTLPYSLHPYGPDAWLIQLRDSAEFSILSKMQSLRHPLIEETVIGYDSLMLRTREPLTRSSILSLLETVAELRHTEPRHHTIEVDYNGPDLDDISRATNLSCDEIIKLHSGALYTVRFLGFSPGFAYLDGLPAELHLPRRPSPRTRMATGAVAIGGAHAGIYTVPSPGGWNWLGHTDHPLFDPSRGEADAFSLHPGDTLTFTPSSC